MAKVLCLSSQVARGHVGASAAKFALERLGHEVWLLPTIVLSNHPGHARSAGRRLSSEDLRAMLDTLVRNGWLGEIDAVLTGYLPSEEHVEVAIEAVERVRNRRDDALILCDPTIGDVPKGLYVDEAAANALRDDLLPQASIVRLNAFELAWLTGWTVEEIDHAQRATQDLGVECVLATSIPAGKGLLANLLWCDGRFSACNVKQRAHAPHGTGDFLSGLFLGHCLSGRARNEALALATAGLEAALDASEDRDELNLVGSQERWAAPKPWPVQKL